MTYRETKKFVKADLDRVNVFGNDSFYVYLRYLTFNSSFKFCFWFRWASYFKNKRLLRPFYCLCWMMHRHYRFKYGYDIPIGTKIGGGMYLMHFGSIVVNGNAAIGENSTIYNGVTIGMARLTGNNVPSIGCNCVLSTGAKVLGNIQIGDYVLVGANAVVTKDIESESVVVGIPAKVINKNGKLYTQEVISHK